MNSSPVNINNTDLDPLQLIEDDYVLLRCGVHKHFTNGNMTWENENLIQYSKCRSPNYSEPCIKGIKT